MRKLLQFLLKHGAKMVLAKYKPVVVGVTGSIGKTSAKEAIAAVMSKKYQTRAAHKNYNNEFGLPLVILGEESGGSSVWAWFKILRHALCLIVRKHQYPECLVLELGIDKPGDMDYLLSIVQLDAAVLTYVGSSHLQYFGTKNKLATEKAKIFKGLKKSGYAILNIDNDLVKAQLPNLKRRVISYGLSGEAGIMATDLLYSAHGAASLDRISGISFKANYNDAVVPIHLPAVVGEPSVYAALAAVAVGLAFDIDGVAISEALGALPAPKGRLRLIEGIRQTMIVDDSYNAAPQSTLAAIDAVDHIRMAGVSRKWIVLGDMLELGNESASGHKEVGRRVAQMPKSRLIYMGSEANYYGVGARDEGMPEERIQGFNNHEEIVDYLRKNIKENDLILVKGSQSMRMEKIIKELMADPRQAKEILVRQEDSWAKR